MSNDKIYYFELGEVVRHITEVIADAARLERESLNNSLETITWYLKGVSNGETAAGVPVLADRIWEKEVRLDAYQKAALLITESLADQAEELQHRCRVQRAAEAAEDCDQDTNELYVYHEGTHTYLALNECIITGAENLPEEVIG